MTAEKQRDAEAAPEPPRDLRTRAQAYIAAWTQGLALGVAAEVLAPLAAAAGAAWLVDTTTAVGVAYWWFWATPADAPVLGAVRGAATVGALVGSLAAAPNSPQAGWWYAAVLGTGTPWLAALGTRAIFGEAARIAREFGPFL